MKSFIKIAFSLIVLFCTIAAQDEDTVLVGSGWNMVGATHTGIPLNILRTEPPDIISSSFFSYNPGGGYDIKDTLQKGYGYWVKVAEEGKIFFHGPGIPCPGTPTVTYSSKVYNTVLIGTQCWLKENLNVGAFTTGTQSDNGTIDKWCYNGVAANCNTWGGLYTWWEAMQYSETPGSRGICPPGWHIPTEGEFQTLKTAVGGDADAIKASGTNTSGFTGLYGGFHSGGYAFINDGGWFWSSSGSEWIAFDMKFNIYHNNILIDETQDNAQRGESVRCLKD